MKELTIFNTGFRLFLISVIAGLALCIVNFITTPAITAKEASDEIFALKELYPGRELLKKQAVNNGHVINRWDAFDGQNLNAVILQLSGNGYGGEMILMAAYKPDGEVINIKLMSNDETPGLGKKAEEPGYMAKFTGKGSISNPLPLTKQDLDAQTGNQPDSVSGATGFKLNASFQDLFFGKPEQNPDSVTGATITFEAIAKVIKEGSDYVKGGSGK